MRRPGAWLLFAGLAALAVAATLDAVRTREDEAGRSAERKSAPPAPTRAAGTGELGGENAHGILYVTQRMERGCAFLALTLPDLPAAVKIEGTPCRVEAGPSGHAVLGRACPGLFAIELRDFTGNLLERPFYGCSPAWTPDGEVTFVNRGNVLALDRQCPTAGNPCFRVVIRAHVITNALRRARLLPAGTRYTMREIGWLSRDRLTAIVQARGEFPTDFIAVLARGRLRLGELTGPGVLSHLHASPIDGEIVARSPREPGGFSVWDEQGRFVATREHVFLADRAYTRSRDGGWIAVAARDRVYLFPADDEGRPSDPYEILLGGVVDLAWG